MREKRRPIRAGTPAMGGYTTAKGLQCTSRVSRSIPIITRGSCASPKRRLARRSTRQTDTDESSTQTPVITSAENNKHQPSPRRANLNLRNASRGLFFYVKNLLKRLFERCLTRTDFRNLTRNACLARLIKHKCERINHLGRRISCLSHRHHASGVF